MEDIGSNKSKSVKLISYANIDLLGNLTSYMEYNFTEISGNEVYMPDNHPMNALINFYKAFNEQDLELMKQNWRISDDVIMYNPVGGIARGWDDIMTIYEGIFSSSARVFVEFYDFSIFHHKDTFVVIGRERGHFLKDEISIDLQVRTSRVYQYHNGWVQVHHHGSIDDVALLRSYQSSIRS